MNKSAFIELGKHLNSYLQKKETPYYSLIESSIHQAEIQNPWFIKRFVHSMLQSIIQLSSEESLNFYTKDFIPTSNPKKILVIAAGNIPMVSYRDVMDVLLSGHILVFKPSSKDNVLMKMILHILQDLHPELKNNIHIIESPIRSNEIDAVIATGTNNTAMHIHQYFSHLPRIVRNNRTSIAILNDQITDEELRKLADDVMMYFGLGCRNVSKLFIPQNFDIQRIFTAIYDYGFVMQHNKYMNNYDYYRSIYLLNKESFLENNFLIVKESQQLHAPVANLFYERYTDLSQISDYIHKHQEDIQCVVGNGYVPFGQTQFPSIDDFADGINTKEFLIGL